jgi:hypothetical protein
MQTAVGALKLLVCCADVPVKPISALVGACRHEPPPESAPLSSGSERAVFQLRDDIGGTDFYAVLYMAHVRQHHFQAGPFDHLRSSCTPFHWRVIQVFRSARFWAGLRETVFAASSRGHHFGLTQHALTPAEQVVDLNAFLFDAARGKTAEGAGRSAANAGEAAHENAQRHWPTFAGPG